ncbi:hypothetical protein GWK47_001095 [Chionoecetes opilio]|uniref:Uncharacterized protein n=1 Tax=Chionoecetes opilio TaxID=41210 RepID=A0A8J4XYA5_CHIOP|nr:hypothetical protein GWK47_001095 [Chionoecetes opilio]
MMYLILSLTLSHQILVHFRYSLLAWLIALRRLLLPINRLLVLFIYLLHLLMFTITHSCKGMMKFLPLNICDQEQLPGVVGCLAHQRGMHLSSPRLLMAVSFSDRHSNVWIYLRGGVLWCPEALKQGGSMNHHHKGAPPSSRPRHRSHVDRRVYNEDGPGQR